MFNAQCSMLNVQWGEYFLFGRFGVPLKREGFPQIFADGEARRFFADFFSDGAVFTVGWLDLLNLDLSFWFLRDAVLVFDREIIAQMGGPGRAGGILNKEPRKAGQARNDE